MGEGFALSRGLLRHLVVPASATGSGTTPSGTGFVHVTAGVQDAAAKLIDTADINASQVTYAKIQNVSATDTLLGRDTAGAGIIEEISMAALRTMGGLFSQVVIQSFTTPGAGTYTPTSGMKYCIVISTGGGGGGGGADTDAGSGHVGVAGGGGAGGTCIEVFDAATIGASASLSVGAAGAVGSGTNGTTGGVGGDSTFGTGPLHTATGGAGGVGSGVSSTITLTKGGGLGGVPTGGLINITGGTGNTGTAGSVDGTTDLSIAYAGQGGGSFWGSGGANAALASGSLAAATSLAGQSALAYGAGGGGAIDLETATGADGGAGMSGIIVVIELV